MSLLGAVTLPVTRYEAGAHASGVWVDGDPVAAFNVVASVQPITPELIEQLPEGARTGARFVLYAEAGQPQLITADIGQALRPDLVTYAGRAYKLQSIGDWSAHTSGLPHQEYVMVQVGDDEPEHA